MATQDLSLRKSEIYGWICPTTGDIVYVGKTSTGIKSRMVCHRGNARRHPKLPSEIWMREQMDADLTVEAIILDSASIVNSAAVEMEWIAHFGLENLLNIRVGGNGNPGFVRVPWDDAFNGMLGKESDGYIARLTGCARSAVSARRRSLGISPKKQAPPSNKVVLPLDIRARLGSLPDYELAKEIGVCKYVIASNRRALGIPSFAVASGNNGRIRKGDAHRRWKPLPFEIQRLLGVLPDFEVGKLIGLSSLNIAVRRRALGIPANKAKMGERAAAEGRTRKRRSDAGIRKIPRDNGKISPQA